MTVEEYNNLVSNKFLNPAQLGLDLTLIDDDGDKVLLQSTKNPHIYYIAEVLAVNRHDWMQLNFVDIFKSNKVIADLNWVQSHENDIAYIDDDLMEVKNMENENVETVQVIQEPVKKEDDKPVVQQPVSTMKSVQEAMKSSNVEPITIKEFVAKYYPLNKVTFISISKTFNPKNGSAYEATRKSWKASDKITQSEIVIALYKSGIIVGIFMPNQWIKDETTQRYEFIGTSVEIPAEYSKYRIIKKPGTANPIRYGF